MLLVALSSWSQKANVESAEVPMIELALPALIPVSTTPLQITLSGTKLDACDIVMLKHYELGYTANATALTSTSAALTFELDQSWPAGSIQVQCYANGPSSNVLVLDLYDPPSITAVTPNRTSVAGGNVLTLSGTGFFPSAALSVSITTEDVSQVATGVFVDEHNTVEILMPQMPIPDSVDLGAIGVGEERLIAATVRLSMNGIDFDEESTVSLSIFISPVFKIGYLYLGVVTDFGASVRRASCCLVLVHHMRASPNFSPAVFFAGWTYNWNAARMEVDSRHPSIIQSEYWENVADEDANDGTAQITDYCERNFDFVVGTSMAFMDAMIAMSFEPVCNYYVDAAGAITDTPKPTYLLHGTGYIQVTALRT